MEAQILQYMAPWCNTYAKVKKRRFVVCQVAGARQRFNSRQNEGMSCALPNPHGKVFKFARQPDARSNQIFVAIFSAKLKN
jgi:hypothetical protein